MDYLVALAKVPSAHHRETIAHSALPDAPVRPVVPRRLRRLRRMVSRPRM